MERVSERQEVGDAIGTLEFLSFISVSETRGQSHQRE